MQNKFKCPISLELMTDPVVASDGCTYERGNITRWLSEHNISPTTNAPIQSKSLFENRALWVLIRKSQALAACVVSKSQLDFDEFNCRDQQKSLASSWRDVKLNSTSHPLTGSE